VLQTRFGTKLGSAAAAFKRRGRQTGFSRSRSIIAEAASRMRHNYAVMPGTRAMKGFAAIRSEHGDDGSGFS